MNTFQLLDGTVLFTKPDVIGPVSLHRYCPHRLPPSIDYRFMYTIRGKEYWASFREQADADLCRSLLVQYVWQENYNDGGDG